MKHTDFQTTDLEAAAPRYRQAGIAIAGPTLLGLIAVSMHPVVSNAHSTQDAINQIAAFAMHDAIMHGFLIVMLTVIAGGFAVFGDLLGAHRGAVRFGKAAYLMGYGAVTAAMLIDGFALPLFAKQFVGGNAVDMQSAFVVLQAIRVFIQVLTKAGIVATSMAFLGWSYALHHHAGNLAWLRRFAMVGYAVGAVSIGVMLFANLWFGPQSLVAVFGVQALWNLCVAAMLLRAGKAVRYGGERMAN